MREYRVGLCAGVVSAGGGMRVSACLRVSAVDRLCGCVCEARRAGEYVKEMLRVRESWCVCETARACVREQVHL